MYRNFVLAGQEIERKFARLAVSRGWTVREARREEDMHQHWDLCISRADQKFLVDVKSRKKLTRNSSAVQDVWIWLERHGVREHDGGWLYAGFADLIVFETARTFVLVDRMRLAALADQLVPEGTERVWRPIEAKYKLYNRDGRHDELTMIEMRHILGIAWDVWPKIEP